MVDIHNRMECTESPPGVERIDDPGVSLGPILCIRLVEIHVMLSTFLSLPTHGSSQSGAPPVERFRAPSESAER